MATRMYLHFYVLVNIFVLSMTENISGNICLEKAFSFATIYDFKGDWRRCNRFWKSTAILYFQQATPACHTCHIEVEYKNNKYLQNIYLDVITIVFDSYNYSTKTGCVNRNFYEAGAQLLINCSHLEKERLDIFLNPHSVCGERNAKCSKWRNLCVCQCDHEYIMHGGHCVKGDQSNSKTIVQTEKQESSRKNIGAILGALLGGLVLGLIIATGIGLIMYRRCRFMIQTRANRQIMFSMNDTYNGDDGVTKQDKQKRALNVSTLARSEESLENRNTFGKQSALTATDDVYNHLNEKEKAQDDDTYDHACATSVSRHANDSEDYSNQPVLDDFAMSGGTETDDYSTIEKI